MSQDSLNRSGIQSSNPALYDTLKELIAFKDKIDDPISKAGLLYDPKLLGPLGTFPQSQGSDIFWVNKFNFIPDSSTGTINNFNPNNISGDTFFINSGVVALNINGLVVGYPGQVIGFKYIGSASINFSHQSINAAINTKLVLNIGSGLTSIANSGVAIFVYVINSFIGGENYWLLISHNQGTPISFTPSLGGVVGNGVFTARYSLANTIVSFEMQFTWGGTTVVGAGAVIQFGLPPYTATINKVLGIGIMLQSGVQDDGSITGFSNSQTTFLLLQAGLTPGFITNGAPWAFAVNDTVWMQGSYYTT